MLELPSIFKPIVGDEVVLHSIDWLENLPWRQDNDIRSHKDKYEIVLCVKDFTPEEIKVKTADGLVIVEGRHDEKEDENGYISRHFVRKYRLPEGCKLDSVRSRLSSDGVLIITAPRDVELKKDMVIPVAHEKSKAKL